MVESKAIHFKKFLNGDCRSNCQAVCAWFKDFEMCESQMIGFSMNETTVKKENNPLNLITVWYRANKRDSDLPMKELKFDLVDADGAGDGWGLINDTPKGA